MGVQAVMNAGVVDYVQMTLAAAKPLDAKSLGASKSTTGTAAASTGETGGASSMAATTTSSSTAAVATPIHIYDKKDLNKDGTVTWLEDLQYDLDHPLENTGNRVNLYA